jgi:hypothetical protein
MSGALACMTADSRSGWRLARPAPQRPARLQLASAVWSSLRKSHSSAVLCWEPTDHACFLLQITTEREFQASNFKLREREYKYYMQANQNRLESIPDLSDLSGGLSNPVLFNFVYYIAWKAACARLNDAQLQSAFSDRFGDALLAAFAPQAAETAAKMRAQLGALQF